jgi:hypothetical protein
MLRLPSLGEMDQGLGVRIYLCTAAVDMRKGFDSLAALVREHLKHDPLSGHLFLFIGRDKDRLKILYWDSDGFAVWYKRVKAEDTPIVGGAKVLRGANNRYIGFAEAGRMVGISRQSGPRRTVMPRQGSRSVPPRAGQSRESYSSTNSGRS